MTLRTTIRKRDGLRVYAGTIQAGLKRARKELREAGFPMAKTTGVYHPYASTKKTTDGVKVSRAGCGESFTIHGYGPDKKHLEAEAKGLLLKLGWPTAPDTLSPFFLCDGVQY